MDEPNGVNPDLLHREFPRTPPYLVGREKIREFARAVQATNPLLFDVESAQAAGYADVIAPTTFPVVIQEKTMTMLLDEPNTGINYSRIVHGSQEFSYARPIVAGDELTAQMRVTDVKTRSGTSVITFETEIRDARDTRVVTVVSGLVVRGDD
ncbi:MAG: hypothetical protein JWQ43_788 [Glaciihabitans sp.]|nr:hypothetical protein [Glaciihabitans sp.]